MTKHDDHKTIRLLAQKSQLLLTALLATIHEEYGSIDTWAGNVRGLPRMPENLDEIVEWLKKHEAIE